MLKLLHIIFAITVMSLAGYALITDDYTIQPYMMLFLSLSMLVMGLREFQKGHKGYGWLSICAFIFILYVSIISFL
ncbi:YczI family protein [Peribacillus sp. NPDC097295]|uniref:YczI family protein n=1 Tax=Peribacillus sp. NPDC097295 TaxID=3364402 RepID=UPI0037FD63C3